MQQGSTNTQAIETRLDIRDIATLHRFYASSGFFPPSKSALIREAIQDFRRILVSNAFAEKFASSEEAIDYLNKFGFALNTRSTSILSLQMDRETIVASSHDEDAIVTPDEVRKAVEMMKTQKESKHGKGSNSDQGSSSNG